MSEDGKCPLCGGKLNEVAWHEEYQGAPLLSESISRCPRGHYSYHWAYGKTEVRVEQTRWGWTYDSAPDHVAKSESEIDRAIGLAKTEPEPRKTPEGEILENSAISS